MLKAVTTSRARQAGVSLVEVLVSVVIVVLGLLGLAGLQSHATVAEMEAFQRAQALVLLQDMVDRVNANRLIKNQVTPGTLGTGNAVQACAPLPAEGVLRDQCEWNNALLGAAETSAAGKVGAMLGARGCVELIQPNMPRVYRVSVVWQGLSATREPTTACGAGAYGNDKMRRAVTADVVIACLQNNPVTGDCIYPSNTPPL